MKARPKGCASILVVTVLMLLGTFFTKAFAQGTMSQITISGTVLDVNNEPVPGASVILKGTKTGTATDVDGSFKLTFKDSKEAILVFSFIGMETKEISRRDLKTGMKVFMKEDANVIDKVVVTGYSTIREESFTGTSTTVDQSSLAKVSQTNVLKALSAFDPSFKMVTDNVQGSNPNNMSEYYIRGRSGVSEVKQLDMATSSDVSEFALKNNPSAPVFILDGFEVDQTTVYDLDISRIKNITILKDAAATAVYGSRAANGVIVIETVEPEPGKIRVNYTNTTSLSMPDLSSYHMMNARQALEAEWYAGLFESTSDDKNAGGFVNYAELYNNVLRGVDTDWIAKPVRTSVSEKNYVYISGGDSSFRWGADINHNSKAGVMKGSSRNTYGASMNLEYKTKKLQVRNKFSFNIMNSKDSPFGQFSDFVRMKPYLTPINPETGTYYKIFSIYRNVRSSVSNPDYVANPLYEASIGSFSKSVYREFVDNLLVSWKIASHLQLRGTFGAAYKVQDDDRFTDPRSGLYAKADIAERGAYRDGDLRTSRWNASLMLAYNRTIGKNHINVTLGAEAAETRSTSEYASYKGFISGTVPSPANALKIVDEPTFGDAHTRRAGTYLQGNYSWDDIYLLDLSGRYEGSSTFGTKNKMGTFWSAGFGVNVHNYGFMENVKWVDRLKLKSTFGVTGKSNFSPYQARTTYQILYDNPYIDQWGMQLKALGNESLKWERVNKLNVGVEFAIFRNLLTAQVDYYRENTIDQIESISIPSSSGFTSYKGNVGKIRNEGVDVKLNLRAFSSKDWDVYLFTNLNHNRNVITEIGDALQSYNKRIDEFFSTYTSSATNTAYSTPFTKYEVGNSLSAIYGMKSLGIDPANGKEIFVKRDGTVTYDWSSAEQQSLGNTDPKIAGTFGFNLRCKNWTMYATFYFRYGGQAYNSTLSAIENVDLLRYSGDVRILTDRWKEPGDVATLKSIADRTSLTRPTSRFVQNANELTFNSLSLSYDFDRALLAKCGLSSLKLTLSTEDMFTLSTIRQERGTAYPYARTVNFGLNLSF